MRRADAAAGLSIPNEVPNCLQIVETSSGVSNRMDGGLHAQRDLITYSSMQSMLQPLFCLIQRKTWVLALSVRSTNKLNGIPTEISIMTHYIAIIEDAGPETAIGVWFPDLPGCFSAGDTIDQALQNAEEALSLYAEGFEDEYGKLPAPRTLTELKADPDVEPELRDNIVALVRLQSHAAQAAE